MALNVTSAAAGSSIQRGMRAAMPTTIGSTGDAGSTPLAALSAIALRHRSNGEAVSASSTASSREDDPLERVETASVGSPPSGALAA
jgi:hypothetical protein